MQNSIYFDLEMIFPHASRLSKGIRALNSWNVNVLCSPMTLSLARILTSFLALVPFSVFLLYQHVPGTGDIFYHSVRAMWCLCRGIIPHIKGELIIDPCRPIIECVMRFCQNHHAEVNVLIPASFMAHENATERLFFSSYSCAHSVHILHSRKLQWDFDLKTMHRISQVYP